MEDKLLKIIKHYGIDKQLKYIHSEYFELDEAIFEYEHDESGYINNKHIAEELADVGVMLQQIKEYYNISDLELIDIMEYKINRQLERINEEKKNNEKM